MANNDLLLQLVIKAVDLATQDIESVNAKVKELGRTLTQSEFSTVGEDMRAFGDAGDDDWLVLESLKLIEV